MVEQASSPIAMYRGGLSDLRTISAGLGEITRVHAQIRNHLSSRLPQTALSLGGSSGDRNPIPVPLPLPCSDQDPLSDYFLSKTNEAGTEAGGATACDPPRPTPSANCSAG